MTGIDELLRDGLREGLRPGDIEDDVAAVLMRVDAPPPRPHRRGGWTRRRLLLAAGGVAVVASAGLASAYILDEDASRDALASGIACLDRPDLDEANMAIVAATDARSPVERCRQVWDEGTFLDNGAPLPTPTRLVACILPGGAVGVLPGEVTCAALGLRPFTDRDQASARQVAALYQRLIRGIRPSSPNCSSSDQAAAVARRALADLGFRDWTVRITAREECVSFGVDGSARVVNIVASPEG